MEPPSSAPIAHDKVEYRSLFQGMSHGQVRDNEDKGNKEDEIEEMKKMIIDLTREVQPVLAIVQSVRLSPLDQTTIQTTV
jgi:hypothetical protein